MGTESTEIVEVLQRAEVDLHERSFHSGEMLVDVALEHGTRTCRQGRHAQHSCGRRLRDRDRERGVDDAVVTPADKMILSAFEDRIAVRDGAAGSEVVADEAQHAA
jgi:hypothetical protein